MTLSDLICVMREGKIVQSGSPREIYGKPRNLYVAGFVGKPKMSLLVGSLDRGDDGVAFVNPDVRIELGSAGELGLADGDWPTVALGIRAEDVAIHPVGSMTDRATFPSTVGLMEPIGSDTFVELLVGDATIVARVDPDTTVAPSQPVSATLRPGGIHLFSRDSGERIVA